RLLSDYLPDSEVSRLDTTARPVSPELWKILRFARDLSRRTKGAFDVTVGPLTQLWRQRKPLTAEARALVEAAKAAGAGAFLYKGKMIDRPVVLAAERLLSRFRPG
ncbi:MAG TPA: FAD:protein FMN transferase, partial [Hyphomonas sp.]|nr:FAD:protein FMN transferase [Hyphomonas sp.]